MKKDYFIIIGFICILLSGLVIGGYSLHKVNECQSICYSENHELENIHVYQHMNSIDIDISVVNQKECQYRCQ